VGSVAYGSGVGKERIIRWDLRSQAFGVHASAASFNDLSMASAEMGHLGLGVAMVQAQVITPVGASMGHLAENIYNMGVANATQGHTVAAPAQTSLQQLVVVAADQGHTATPNVLSKTLLAANAEMGHEATPDTLAKVVLAANATQGHTADAIPIGLTIVNATMGHSGLAVEFPTGGAANLTVVAGTMPHDGLAVEGFSPTQLPDLKLWLAPESGVVVSGSRVEQWNDKSGLGNHATQTVSAAMPVHVSALADLNGHNAVRLLISGTRLYSTNAAAVSAIATSALSQMSGTVVVEQSAVNNGILWQGCATSSNANTRRLIFTGGKYTLTEVAGGVASAATGGSGKTTPVVFRWTWASAKVNAWENGVGIITSAHVSAGNNIAIGAAAHMCVGAGADGANVFLGHMAELIIAATAWSSSQGRELDKLLGAKYGIAIT
jgi:hypothetical protein